MPLSLASRAPSPPPRPSLPWSFGVGVIGVGERGGLNGGGGKDGECGWWERRRRRAESANERGCRSRLLPARLHRIRARRFLGPRRRRPRAFVARLDRSLRTRVLTRPAGKTAHERGDTSNGTSPRRILLQKPEDPSGPHLLFPGHPSGSTGGPSQIRNEPTAASLDLPVHAAPSARSLHTITSCHPLAPPARAARFRRPPAPPARAAHSRRPLAPPACVRHAVLLVLRRYGDDARDISTKALTSSDPSTEAGRSFGPAPTIPGTPFGVDRRPIANPQRTDGGQPRPPSNAAPSARSLHPPLRTTLSRTRSRRPLPPSTRAAARAAHSHTGVIGVGERGGLDSGGKNGRGVRVVGTTAAPS